jgi:hypothetical protein
VSSPRRLLIVRPAALDPLPFLIGPPGGLLTQQKPSADVQGALAEDLRFPAIALAAKVHLARPGDVILPEGPDHPTRPPLPRGRAIGPQHRVVGVAHRSTIPRGVTGEVQVAAVCAEIFAPARMI